MKTDKKGMSDMGNGMSQPATTGGPDGMEGPIVLGYQGLAEIIGRMKRGTATNEERARVLVLAEEIEGEVSELASLAERLRGLVRRSGTGERRPETGD